MSGTNQMFGITDAEATAVVSGGSFLKTMKLSKLKIGQKVKLRILRGPAKMDRVFLPTIRMNQEGIHVEGWESFTVADRWANYFTAIALADKQVQREKLEAAGVAIKDPKKIKSIFDPTTTYVILAISRDWNPLERTSEPVIEAVEVPYFAAEKILKLRDPDIDDPTKMLQGPHIFYDVVIGAYEDPKMANSNVPDYMKRRYSVDAYKNKWAGECPIEWRDGLPADFDLVAKGVLTEDEFVAAAEFVAANDLAEITKFDTPEEITERLKTSKLNLFATRKNERVLPYAAELVERLTAFQIPYFSQAETEGMLGPIQEGEVVNGGSETPPNAPPDEPAAKPEEAAEAKPAAKPVESADAESKPAADGERVNF